MRPANFGESLDTWVWGPKKRVTIAGYGTSLRREHQAGAKEVSRLFLVLATALAALFGVIWCIHWLCTERTHWLPYLPTG